MALTAAERKLLREVIAISETAALDHWNIEIKYDPDERLIRLKHIQDRVVRAAIINRYTLIDELLACIIADTYFHRKKTETTHQRLWKQKRFRLFCYHILDNLHFLEKTRLVHELKPLPKRVRELIDHLNAIRNAIAHSYFPENRGQFRKEKAVTYKGAKVFSLEGFSQLNEESLLVCEYLDQRAFGNKAISENPITD